ncbi:hypothetical protein OD91_0191 [Lutibacter sp. Hel_I_33_5]|uniref:peptidylprolyl isomerase n=1 Tax=Lutibacter sp. Hel_I_33_5 TaxID=1566289 RepID=UPI0011A80B8E|nr:peptidylprolyl isomerase [Lutibacter sp. Hel_I_33_5]TVZ54953.1 hypothetical protein OD91_0191 [Lutibacter sp. Hel_I_33_5]
MNKLKYFIALITFSVIVYSCGDDGTFVDDFDHEAQAKIDDTLLIEFFKGHYYDTSIDSIKPIVSGKTNLFSDSKLKTQKVTFNEIEYNLYTYVKVEGNPVPNKPNPTIIDSILVNYHLGYIKDSIDYIPVQKLNAATWFNPTSIAVEGWLHGFTNFKGGKNTTNNGPITYIGGGNGIIFIPSGIAYRNIGNLPVIPTEANLIYYVNLFDSVEGTDHDNDGVASIDEDINGDGDPRNDDTDGDTFADMSDPDDDNDGKLTKDEDTNGDGDPRNDDTDGDGIPNYLDSDS